MMEAVRSCETSINFNLITRRYIPEDSKHHTRCHENLKSHMYFSLVARKEFPTVVIAVSFRAMSIDPYFIIMIIIWLYSPSRVLASPFWVL